MPVRIPTMLGGLLSCGVCGGVVSVERKVWGTPKPGEPRKSILLYCCQTHRRGGQPVYSNAARRPGRTPRRAPDGRFKLSGRIAIADCDPIDVEDGRPVRPAKMRGLKSG